MVGTVSLVETAEQEGLSLAVKGLFAVQENPAQGEQEARPNGRFPSAGPGRGHRNHRNKEQTG